MTLLTYSSQGKDINIYPDHMVFMIHYTMNVEEITHHAFKCIRLYKQLDPQWNPVSFYFRNHEDDILEPLIDSSCLQNLACIASSLTEINTSSLKIEPSATPSNDTNLVAFLFKCVSLESLTIFDICEVIYSMFFN